MNSTNSQTAGPPSLPDPDDHATRDVILYDGHCRFCTAQVKRLRWLDTKGRLTFISLHDPRVAERYPDLSYDQLMEQMYLVDPHGGRHAGAGAFRYLTRHLPLLWPLAPLLHFPFSLPVWHWLYMQVARRRYLFGKTTTCDDGACAVHFQPRRERNI